MQTTKPWPNDGLEAVPNCPVCGSTQRKMLYNDLTDRVFGVAPGIWTLYRCTQCESAYLDPRPTDATIGLAYAQYFTHVVEDHTTAQQSGRVRTWVRYMLNDYRNARYGARRQHSNRLGRWLVPLAPPLKAAVDATFRHMPKPPEDGGRLLDVGCGNGSFLALATEMGWNAEGIDFDPNAIEIARARGLNAHLISTTELTTQNKQFDIITLSHVIEHVHDPVALLKDLHQLLKPGGRLWLETPNLNSIGAQKFGPNWRGLEPPRHLVLFTRNGLKQALQEAGFSRIQQKWRGLVVFSIFAASEAIEAKQDKDTSKASHNREPAFDEVITELHEMLRPSKREFLTLVAEKE